MGATEAIKELGDTLAKNQHDLQEAVKLAEEKQTVQLSEHKGMLLKMDTEFTGAVERIKALESEIANKGVDLAGLAGKGNEVELAHQTSALANYLRDGNTNYSRDGYSLALTSAPDSAGGFLVPEFIERGIVFDAANPVGMLKLITPRTLTKGDSVSINKMSRPVVSRGKKGVDVPEQLFTTGRARFDMKFITASYVADTDFLADSDENVVAELNTIIREAFDVAVDEDIVAGATEDTMDGFLVNTAVQANAVNSGLAALLGDNTLATNGHDVIIDVAAIPKSVYTSDAAYVMNRFTAAAVRKLKDLNGQYLWSQGTEKGMYGMVNGFPVQIIEAMPNIAANTFPIAFGSFNRAYRFYNKANGISVTRLDEKYAASGHVGFIFRKRVLGGVRQPEALALIKIAV